jgi:hypothetical protein
LIELARVLGWREAVFVLGVIRASLVSAGVIPEALLGTKGARFVFPNSRDMTLQGVSTGNTMNNLLGS